MQIQIFKYLLHAPVVIGTDKHQQVAVEKLSFTGSLNSRKQQVMV